MDIQKLKAKILEEMIESINQKEDKEFRKQGCLEGVELARSLVGPEEFERTLNERHQHENELLERYYNKEVTIEDYWRYHCATAQVEFVFERLKVVWPGYSTTSGNALMYVHRLLYDFERKN